MAAPFGLSGTERSHVRSPPSRSTLFTWGWPGNLKGRALETNLSEAKQTLLRALESIEEAEQEMDTEVSFLCVTYEMHRRTDKGNVAHSGGWNHSDAPDWVIAAMLRKCADAIERQDPIDEED